MAEPTAPATSASTLDAASTVRSISSPRIASRICTYSLRASLTSAAVASAKRANRSKGLRALPSSSSAEAANRSPEPPTSTSVASSNVAIPTSEFP